jgi:chitodextrinase
VIDPRLQILARCATPDQTYAVIVRFAATVDVRDSELQQVFERLGARDMVVLWIIHSIAATVPGPAIPEFANLPGVENIRLNEPLTLPPQPELPQPVNFAPPFMVGLGIRGVHSPLLADVNGMGFKDALIPFEEGEARIGVYFGEGVTPFQDTTGLAIGTSLDVVKLADFNADNIADLVVSAVGEPLDTMIWSSLCATDLSVNHTLRVFLGNGDGTFQPATCLVVEASTTPNDSSIGGMAVADFNGDCRADIAVSGISDIGTGYVATFLSNGDGSFFATRKIAGLSRPGALYAGYFSSDAHMDLLVVDDGHTAIYAGDGQGEFSLSTPDPRGPVQLVGNINNDAILDLLVYDPVQDEITVLLGNSDGSFTDGQMLSSGVSPLTSLQFADLNGDMQQDLVFVSESQQAVHVFFGSASGSFITPAQVIPVAGGIPPIHLTVDDLNADGRLDLFVVFANAGWEATATALLQTVAEDNPADSEIPSVPASVMVTDTTQTTVTLAWEASTDNVGVTGYRLYEYVWINRFVSQWILKLDSLITLSATVTDLNPGSPHTYAVTAVDAAGNESAQSAAVEVRTLQPPTVYHPIYGSNGGVFAIVDEPFTYNIDAIGHPAPQFSLVAGPAGLSVDASSGIVRWTPAAGDEGIVTVTVRATNSQGSADHTFSVQVYPAGTDRVPPSAERTLVATNITANGCTLTWEAATDNARVVGYLILAQRVGRGHSLFIAGDTAGPETTHTLTTLKPGTGYRLWVAPYDAAGNRATISGVPPEVIITLTAP